MARSFVARQLVAMGGQPELRTDFVTDNGNVILDVHNMDLVDPVRVERDLNNLPGVLTCGLWALRPAECVLMASAAGVQKFA
jgi:ribose 5-phosphate isomerase A